MLSAVRNPNRISSIGLASFAFARHYLRNLGWFLFLALLRCFSSGGSPPYVMDWRMDDWSSSSRVSPFRYLRIKAYLQLPVAFRSLSRLSSALSAKASTLRSFLLNHSVDFLLKELYGLQSISDWSQFTTYLSIDCCILEYLYSRMSW